MSKELQGISYICGAINIPGVQSFEYVPIEYVEDFEELEVNTTTGYLPTSAITFKSGRTWLTGKGLYRSGNHPEAHKRGDHGNSFDAGFTVLVPTDSPSLRNEINRMTSYRYMLKIFYPDGHSKLIGTIEHPLTLKADFNSGTSVGTLKGHTLSFEGSNRQKAWFYK